MTFDWANDQLLIGNTWFGCVWIPACLLQEEHWRLCRTPGIPSRAPQIRWTHKFGRRILPQHSVLSIPAWWNWMAARQTITTDDYTRSNTAERILAGKICIRRLRQDRSFKLIVGMSGVYGRKIYTERQLPRARPWRYLYSQKQEDGWLAQAFSMIPIIPERNKNKAGALSVLRRTS